jgi:hypothetical protein
VDSTQLRNRVRRRLACRSALAALVLFASVPAFAGKDHPVAREYGSNGGFRVLAGARWTTDMP